MTSMYLMLRAMCFCHYASIFASQQLLYVRLTSVNKALIANTMVLGDTCNVLYSEPNISTDWNLFYRKSLMPHMMRCTIKTYALN